MSIHHTFTLEPDLLLVKATGFDETLADLEAYGRAIIQTCLERGVTRVLCDESALEYRLDTFDTYWAAEFMSQHVPALAKAAIVCQPRGLEAARFWEDTAVNRGLHVRVFTDLAAARGWLQGSSQGR
jgi:hypothetical protein